MPIQFRMHPPQLFAAGGQQSLLLSAPRRQVNDSDRLHCALSQQWGEYQSRVLTLNH
jgi:hypothetical protein